MNINEQNDELNDEAEFDAAFAEDETEDHSGGDTDQAATDDDDNSSSDDSTDQDDSELDTDEDADYEAAGDQDDSDNTDDDQQNDDDADNDDEEAEKERQRKKSWEGRLKKRERELQEREDKLNEQGKKPDAESDDDNADDDNDPDLDDENGFLEDFPELASTVDKIVEKRLSPVLQQREAEAAEKHLSEITSKHSDFQEIVNDESFDDWIENLPYRDAVQMKSVCKQGTSSEVVEMLDRYKNDDRKKQEREKLKARRDKQKAAGKTVPNHSSRVSNTSGNDDPNDFDAGFDDD